ncbi:kinase-like domain-containing protein [Catenaria anguillulae PL171]|uniref:non-specific serine/threonine protein kinase n=1 Tax=Catenaria anguillulae PL171 TaxID=765915 RepID=A0A1Y2HH64_9FUNG|nr:kinase-like domain-containing protein [Catenaria anguillulae PL171]
MSAKPKSPKKIAEETNPDVQLPGIGNYAFVKTLGEGNFAKVKLAKHKMTGQEVAIKIIDKTQLDDKKLQKLYREVRIMKLLHHPNIVRLYEVIETKSTVFLVMEYSSGGELYDYLVVHGRMKEKEARAKFRQILSAVSYCHKKRVIHRDLKVRRELLLDTNLDLDTFCGSPPYAAPELFQGRRYVGPEVDVWSLGVILYVLTTGCLPFDGKNLQEMRESVCRGKYRIPFYLSDSCEKLLRKFLVRDPTKRASLDIIADDPWLNEGYNEPPICNDLSMRIEEDENIIKMIENKFHIERDVILKSIRDNVYDDISALYYLMYHERDRTGDYSRVNQVINGATLPGYPAVGGSGASSINSSSTFGPNGTSAMSGVMPMAAITLPRMPAGGSSSSSSSSSGKDSGVGSSANSSSGSNSGTASSGGTSSRDAETTASGNKMMPIAEDAVMGHGPMPPPGLPTGPPRHTINAPGSASSSTARSVSTTPRRRRFTVGTEGEMQARAGGAPGAPGADGSGADANGPPMASPTDMMKPGTAPVSPTSPTSPSAAAAGMGPHTSVLGGTMPDDDGPRKRNNTIVGILRSTMGRSRTADNGGTPTGSSAIGQAPTSGAGTAGGNNGGVNGSVQGSSSGVAGKDGVDDVNRPRSLRFTFNSNTTSSKPPDEVVALVVDACGKLGVTHKLISRYLIECQYAVPQTRDVVRFEVEVCKLPRLKNLHGLKFKRLSGPSNDYKVVCESLLANVSL